MKYQIRLGRLSPPSDVSLGRVMVSCCLAACLVSPAALAGPRKPAPIVFAGQGGGTASANTGQDTQVPPSARSGKRVEYRYPDRPDVVYDQSGARAAEAGAPPIAFSSSEAAIGAMQTRQYAAITPASPTTDPAITAGGFDARAAAARAATARQPNNPIAEAPLEAMPTPVNSFSPRANPDYDETGLASIYPADFAGVPSANGEIIDLNAMTAAHPSLPLPSLVQVINLSNGKEIVVRVNDRGPFEDGRLIELSPRAAGLLDLGVADNTQIRVRYLGAAPAIGSPQPELSETVATAPTSTQTPTTVPAPTPVVSPKVTSPPPTLRPVARSTVAASGAVTGADYFIQAGSFSDIGNAERLHRQLSNDFGVKIVPARVRGTDFFRVLLGPFSGRDAAQTTRDRLAASGVVDGLVISGR